MGASDVTKTNKGQQEVTERKPETVIGRKPPMKSSSKTPQPSPETKTISPRLPSSGENDYPGWEVLETWRSNDGPSTDTERQEVTERKIETVIGRQPSQASRNTATVRKEGSS